MQSWRPHSSSSHPWVAELVTQWLRGGDGCLVWLEAHKLQNWIAFIHSFNTDLSRSILCQAILHINFRVAWRSKQALGPALRKSGIGRDQPNLHFLLGLLFLPLLPSFQWQTLFLSMPPQPCFEEDTWSQSLPCWGLPIHRLISHPLGYIWEAA